MTREEEITKQSILYTSQVCPACISGDNIFDEEVRDLNRNKAFEAGAKWADEHPNHDSLWHEPSEEPKDETHILIEYDYLGSKELKSYNIGDGLVNWERFKKNYGISRWAYISDILPKGDKKMINYEEFDKECVELCKTLNNMDNVETTESCCGHLKDKFVIFFRCDNFSTLAKISRSVNENYSDGKWELLVVDTDRYPCCNFWLRSKEPFKTEIVMNESVNRLIDNLRYWQKDEFKEYFKTK